MSERTETSCHDEHHHHHGHSHDDDDHQLKYAMEETLYPSIDTLKLTCLNEHKRGCGKTVFKPWDKRLSSEDFVKSGVDTELLFYVPFTAAVQPKSIIIVGTDDGSAPDELKLYKNKDNLDFSNIESAKPEQILKLNVDTDATLEYNLRASKFLNTNSLVLYFPTNFGAKKTKIDYIGLKGVATKNKRQIIETVYESKPQMKDHKIKEDFGASKSIQ